MVRKAELVVEGKCYELPIIAGTEGEMGIDISGLRRNTGLITFDPGYANTGCCRSAITFTDGEKGVLRYRGISIEQLAERCSFVETAFLLINGRLPTQRELNRFSSLLNDNSFVQEGMWDFLDKFPHGAHPMGMLSSTVNALAAFYPEIPEQSEEEEINITVARLLSIVRTMAAMSYNMSRRHEIVDPRHELTYAANFLNMMFDKPARPYEIDEDHVRALNVFWILHADHEQNCSTAAVRLVGSAKVNLYTAISAGICALWGPLHGGAEQAVIEMLNEIKESGGNPKPFIARARDRNDPFRLMGFGHRVYKTYDPRALIMKKWCYRNLEKQKTVDPLLDIAIELEAAARKDSYFIDHNLYPNVDFYSGIVLKAIGIPINMFTVMFAIGRLSGWISQWKESMEDADWKLHRPRQIYTGLKERNYIPLKDRGSRYP